MLRAITIGTLTAFLLATWIRVSPLYAESQENLFGMSLEDVLGVQVSTASKMGGRADHAPGNIVIITQEDIRRFGYRTVGDAIGRAAGFSYTDLGASSSIGFRGLTPPSYGTSARILFLINGMRYNDFAYDSALINESFPLDMESIDRIEVLKGAGSAIWGSNALYAVVNIISKDGASQRNKQLSGTIASNDARKGYLSWGSNNQSDFKYFTSISFLKSDGDLSAFFPAQHLGQTDLYSQGNLDREAARGQIRLDYSNWYTNVIYDVNKANLGSTVDQLAPPPGSDEYRLMPLRAETGYKYKVNTEDDLSVKGTYFEDDIRARFNYNGIVTPLDRLFASQKLNVKTGAAEVKYTSRLSKSLKGIVGSEWTRNFSGEELLHQQLFQEDGSLLFDDINTQSYDRTTDSVFFDVMYEHSNPLTLFVGGRYDKASELDGIFGPRASMIYEPEKGTILKLMYSTGFRNPALGESRIFQAQPQRLVAEKMSLYEALIEQQFQQWLTLKGSVFYSDFKNSIDTLFSEGVTTYYTNFKGFKSKGLELEAQARMEKFLQSYFTISFTDAQNKELDQDVKSLPSYLGRLGISWSYDDLIILSPELMFGGTTSTTPSEPVEPHQFDSFMLTNLTLLSYPMGQGGSVSTSVYNVFADSYSRLSGGPLGMERSIKNDREFLVQVRWDF